MDFFSLDPRELPTKILYRVQTPQSMTSFNPSSGLSAIDTQTIYTSSDCIFEGFGDAVEAHLNWRSGRRSIFISLFANRRHADNWALRYSQSNNGVTCTVYEIDASKLMGSYVFHADEIYRCLCLTVPERAEMCLPDEYLVIHRIPLEAIMGWRTTDDIKREQLNQSAFISWFLPNGWVGS